MIHNTSSCSSAVSNPVCVGFHRHLDGQTTYQYIQDIFVGSHHYMLFHFHRRGLKGSRLQYTKHEKHENPQKKLCINAICSCYKRRNHTPSLSTALYLGPRDFLSKGHMSCVHKSCLEFTSSICQRWRRDVIEGLKCIIMTVGWSLGQFLLLNDITMCKFLVSIFTILSCHKHQRKKGVKLHKIHHLFFTLTVQSNALHQPPIWSKHIQQDHAQEPRGRKGSGLSGTEQSRKLGREEKKVTRQRWNKQICRRRTKIKTPGSPSKIRSLSLIPQQLLVSVSLGSCCGWSAEDLLLEVCKNLLSLGAG